MSRMTGLFGRGRPDPAARTGAARAAAAPTGGLRLTGFGHSHLSTFHRAQVARQRAGRAGPTEPDLVLAFLGDRTVGANFRGAGAAREVAPRVRDSIARTLAERPPEAVFCILMGNEYNALAMVRPPRPFDFDLPGEPPRDPAVPAISPVQMRAQMADLAGRNALLLWREIAARAEAAGAAVYLLPPPPPIASEAHIRAHPGAFGALVARHGLNPPPLRRKLWLLYRDALRQAVRDSASRFIDLPDGIFENGFLAERFWQGDPTHANGAYGEIMLELICRRIRADREAAGQGSAGQAQGGPAPGNRQRGEREPAEGKPAGGEPARRQERTA